MAKPTNGADAIRTTAGGPFGAGIAAGLLGTVAPAALPDRLAASRAEAGSSARWQTRSAGRTGLAGSAGGAISRRSACASIVSRPALSRPVVSTSCPALHQTIGPGPSATSGATR